MSCGIASSPHQDFPFYHGVVVVVFRPRIEPHIAVFDVEWALESASFSAFCRGGSHTLNDKRIWVRPPEFLHRFCRHPWFAGASGFPGTACWPGVAARIVRKITAAKTTATAAIIRVVTRMGFDTVMVKNDSAIPTSAQCK